MLMNKFLFSAMISEEIQVNCNKTAEAEEENGGLSLDTAEPYENGKQRKDKMMLVFNID